MIQVGTGSGGAPQPWHTDHVSREDGEPAEPGNVERGVLKDLSRLPEDLRSGGIAQVALYAARQLDGLNNAFDLPARDAAAFLAQVRHCMTQLRDWAPGEVEDDPTENKRQAREKRMLATVTDIESKYA
jgi:hypothetical protein